jgi:hypothetical protein
MTRLKKYKKFIDHHKTGHSEDRITTDAFYCRNAKVAENNRMRISAAGTLHFVAQP